MTTVGKLETSKRRRVAVGTVAAVATPGNSGAELVASVIGRSACGRDRHGVRGQPEVIEDVGGDPWIGDEGEHAQGIAAARTGEPLVCELGLARSATQHGLAVGKPPAGALAMKAALAVSLDHGPVMEHVPPSLVIDLITAIVEFDGAEPWNAFDADEAIAIRFEPDGREVEGCVMGQAGEESGLPCIITRAASTE